MEHNEQQLIDFACQVCREKLKYLNGKYSNCAYRAIEHDYCPYIYKALEKVKENREENENGKI